MIPATRFLVVEADAPTLRCVELTLGTAHRFACAATLGSARRMLSKHDWTGILIALSLPDGDGLEILRDLRHQRDGVPVLMLDAHPNVEHINEVQALSAQYVCKPPRAQNIDRFVDFALAHALLDDGDLADRLDRVATHYQLTAREVEYVALSARGVERRDLALLLGVSDNTVKSQLRALLVRVDANTYAGLARLLLIR